MADKKLVSMNSMREFIISSAKAAGASEIHSKSLSDVLVEADYRGHYSHGANRLQLYINDLLNKSINGFGEPKILKETPAVAWVDGCNIVGTVVGEFCMNLAIEKAKGIGIGCVSVNGSNHFGIAGWYGLMAEKMGLIGMAMTNTTYVMTPTRGSGRVLGTNPICLAASSSKPDDGFCLDMATSTVAFGKIEMKQLLGEPLPDQWAYDESGHQTADANIAMKSKCLSPLGGGEMTGGYKGYGLSAMVEVLCGVLAGANMLTEIEQFTGNKSNLGQFFMAIDPSFFCPGFGERLAKMNQFLRDVSPIDPLKPVLVPGDPERAHMKMVDDDGGIFYQTKQIEIFNEIAAMLSIDHLNIF